jgi:hypothetical protein
MKNKAQNWREYLLEIFVIALTLCSALTTFVGARKLVNEVWLVAALFTAGIQGGLYYVAHCATNDVGKNLRRKTISLYLTWLLLSIFSVYSSALGMFELQKDSLRNDHERNALAGQWRLAADEITRFRTNALSWLTGKIEEVGLQFTLEKAKEQASRKLHKDYSPREKQTLKSRLDSLNTAKQKVEQVKILGASTPSKSEDIRAALDAAFASATDAYALLPEGCRSQYAAPRNAFTETLPTDIQKAFWAEVQSRSVPAILMLLIAFLLDFLPISIRFASQPKKAPADKIINARREAVSIWKALWVPISPATKSFRIAIENYPELDISLKFASNRGEIYLTDLHNELPLITTEVSERLGSEVQLRSAKNSSGEELVSDLPLSMQVTEDEMIFLSFEPQPAEV